MNIHDVQVNLRLPIELKEKIQEIAKRNGHTLNAELNMRLKDSLSTPTQGNQKQALEDIYGFFENYQKNRRLGVLGILPPYIAKPSEAPVCRGL